MIEMCVGSWSSVGGLYGLKIRGCCCDELAGQDLKGREARRLNEVTGTHAEFRSWVAVKSI